MSRLIDADALIKAWRKKHKIKEGDCGAVFVGYSEIPRLIDEQPTVDAVEVVRCKDCKNWDRTWTNSWTKDYHYCPMVDGVRKVDFYCADAERKNDED